MCQRLRVPIVLELQGESQPSTGMIDAGASGNAILMSMLHKFWAYKVSRAGATLSGRLRYA
jgi:hypothetical protein